MSEALAASPDSDSAARDAGAAGAARTRRVDGVGRMIELEPS